MSVSSCSILVRRYCRRVLFCTLPILSWPLFGAASSEPAPVLSTGNVLDTVGGLALVLGLLLGVAWLVKRYMSVPGISKGRIQVVGGVSLGPRERAVIVEVDGERLLLGVAQGNVRLLHHLELANTRQEAFGEALEQAQDQREAAQ